MPTPPKPARVIELEKKSHRTKKELSRRKEEEEALLSGKSMKERPEVKNCKEAHKEYVRINRILKAIKKNDAIYEPVINRYCLLQTECRQYEERREEIYQTSAELKIAFAEISEGLSPKERAPLLLEFTKEIAKLTASMIACDRQLQSKRKMLLDIEKENIMTIAAALRTIPKKEKDEDEDDPMTALLSRRV